MQNNQIWLHPRRALYHRHQTRPLTQKPRRQVTSLPWNLVRLLALLTERRSELKPNLHPKFPRIDGQRKRLKSTRGLAENLRSHKSSSRGWRRRRKRCALNPKILGKSSHSELESLRRWKGNGRSKQKKQRALQDGGWDYSRDGEGRSERAEGGDRKILCIDLRRHRCGVADGEVHIGP